MNRRKFLQLAGSFTASAVSGGILSGCHNNTNNASDSVLVTVEFPQGVASGDPTSSSVVLWTRAKPSASQPVAITCEVATSNDFSLLVSNEVFEVDDSSDYTLRVLLEDLEPDTFYYYRFIFNDVSSSITGRTRTAPASDQQTPVNFAFVSCQERLNGFYSAYRRMIMDDELLPDNEQIRFVLHLGDFIYETRNEAYQQPVDEYNNPIADCLTDSSGKKRTILPFPDGGVTLSGVEHAQTLDDYRYLYKNYLSDPDLQAARARWPFICIWDDHEFSNDCWQTEANYLDAGENSGLDEPSQQRKVSANQAWFEYTPVNLGESASLNNELVHTKPFEFASVNNTENSSVNDMNMADNEDNLAAIDTMTIYRSLRFGRLVNLVLTDNRSYRSDHAIPETISGNSSYFLQSRVAVPLFLLNQLDAGKTANNNNPDTHVYAGDVVPNPRFSSPPGTILGNAQKQWWKEVISRSDSDWNLWGNSVPLMRVLLNLNTLDSVLPDVVLSADTWDGYRTERNELMSFLFENDIANVVSFSGDVHAHMAGVVMQDYELFHDSSTNSEAVPLVSEVVCAGVSSRSQFSAVEALTRIDNPNNIEQQMRNLITYDDSNAAQSSENTMVNNLNNTILNGVRSGLIASITNLQDDIEQYKDSLINGHLNYVDTDANGYGLAKVTADNITVQLVSIDGIHTDPSISAPEIKRIAEFTIPKTTSSGEASISNPQFQGTPPFPFI